MLGINTSNAPERRPNAEIAAAMRKRVETFAEAAGIVLNTVTRTQPLATRPVAVAKVEAAPKPIVTTEIASNVISFVEKHEALKSNEQDRRIAEARSATDAAHQPYIDKSLQDIGYEAAA